MVDPSSLEGRVDAIERRLTELAEQIAQLQAALRITDQADDQARLRERLLHAGPPHAPPRAEASAQASVPVNGRGDTLDIESLLGRYGMLIIAVLAAVAAVGTFLSWAISHGYLVLGPTARIAIGLAAAAAIGVWGLRLRRRERSFGSSMLGLALVIVLVCAYAAGASFALVPPWVAFGAAAVLSWALALFAHGEDDEPLWCVGFGGAAAAPFVTSGNTANVYLLAAYATMLLVTACIAVRGRRWTIAWRVFYVAAAVLVLTAAFDARSAPTASTAAFIVAYAVPFVVAIVGVIPCAPASHARGALRWMALLALLASTADGLAVPNARTERAALLVAMIAGFGVWLVLIDVAAALPQSSAVLEHEGPAPVFDWCDAALLPLLFAARAAAAADLLPHLWTLLAAFAAVLALFASRRPVSAAREAAAFAAVLLALGTVSELHLATSAARVGALVGVALASLVMHRLRPAMSWLGLALAVLVIAALASVDALTVRRSFAFTPFMTNASAAALIVTIALALVARVWRALRAATRTAMGARHEWTYARGARRLVKSLTLAPWVWAFLWVLIELAMAFGPSTSTLLLVAYFAITAVCCVAVGRARRKPRIRQTGLALGVAAAVAASYGASTYFDFAARIVAYLVTSAFLLGIAYWYRRPGQVAPADERAL